MGVLDLFRDQPGLLGVPVLADALCFADAATAILLHLQGDGPDEDGGDPPIAVLTDRAEVHQATGAIAEQAGVSLAQALVLLRARAFATERPIVALARDVLGRLVLFTDDARRGDEPFMPGTS